VTFRAGFEGVFLAGERSVLGEASPIRGVVSEARESAILDAAGAMVDCRWNGRGGCEVVAVMYNPLHQKTRVAMQTDS